MATSTKKALTAKEIFSNTAKKTVAWCALIDAIVDDQHDGGQGSTQSPSSQYLLLPSVVDGLRLRFIGLDSEVDESTATLIEQRLNGEPIGSILLREGAVLAASVRELCPDLASIIATLELSDPRRVEAALKDLQETHHMLCKVPTGKLRHILMHRGRLGESDAKEVALGVYTRFRRQEEGAKEVSAIKAGRVALALDALQRRDRHVDLSSCKLSAEDIRQSIQKPLVSNTLLVSLDIRGNHIHGKAGGELLADAVGQLPHLQTMNISGNPLLSVGLSHIFKAVARNASVRCLLCAGCSGGRETMVALKEALDNNAQIRQLDLSGNNLGEISLNHVPVLRNLYSLSLAQNGLKGDSVSGIVGDAAGLVWANDGTFCAIRELDLSGNLFSAADVHRILNGLSATPQLTSQLRVLRVTDAADAQGRIDAFLNTAPCVTMTDLYTTATVIADKHTQTMARGLSELRSRRIAEWSVDDVWLALHSACVHPETYRQLQGKSGAELAKLRGLTFPEQSDWLAFKDLCDSPDA